MRKMMFKYVLLLAVIMPLAFYACTKDEEKVTIDKVELVAKIESADSVYNSAEVGKLAGQYTQSVVDAFKTAIDAAKSINSSSDATQEQVDATVSNLQTAINTFKAAAIVEISATNLVAYWKLDGDGTDASGNGHNGTLMVGPTDRFPAGGTLPTATTDRYGASGKALHFANGSNIEVPFAATLNPDEMTISVWLKADSLCVSRTQYILSLNIWNTWKFELPNHGKPFVTRKLSDDVYLNFDSNPVVLEPLTWYQVITTIDATKCTFYIDGVMVVEWPIPSTAKPVTADPLVNLVIGTFLPNTPVWTMESWFTSFHGNLDDIRIYNKALTAAEVEALHNMEVPE